MKSKISILIMILLPVFTSCSKDYELGKSVFVADKDYPSLPAYSEWGYNTFGVLYDRQPLVNTDYRVPAKLICTGGISTFSLRGHLGQPDYYYYYQDDEEPIMLNFELVGFEPSSVDGLLALNDSIIDLTDPLCRVTLKMDTTNYDLDILNGTLHFKKAQALIVDEDPYEIILSGTFDFQAIIDNEPRSFSNGRFDVGIAEDNFFRY